MYAFSISDRYQRYSSKLLTWRHAARLNVPLLLTGRDHSKLFRSLWGKDLYWNKHSESSLCLCVHTQNKILLLSSIDSTCPVHCVGAPARIVFLQMWLNLCPCKRTCLCPLHRSPALFKLSGSIRSPILLFSHALERQRATFEYWAGESRRPGQRMQRREGNKWRWYLWLEGISSF